MTALIGMGLRDAMEQQTVIRPVRDERWMGDNKRNEPHKWVRFRVMQGFVHGYDILYDGR